MANLRYGMKEVANVIFFDIDPNSPKFGKPVAFLDTLKVSSIENESETAEARGGRGNNKLMTWDYGRTANLSISDALLSDTTIEMLAGNAMKEASEENKISIVGREQFELKGSRAVTLAVENATKITVFKYTNGLIANEILEADPENPDKGIDLVALNKVVTIPASLHDGVTVDETKDSVMVFYEYEATTGANQITFSGEAFPATYRVVGETLVRGEDGVDRKMQFEIPKAKMQSTFSLTMDVENVATFDFTLEVLMDAQSKEKELYKITRLDGTAN